MKHRDNGRAVPVRLTALRQPLGNAMLDAGNSRERHFEPMRRHLRRQTFIIGWIGKSDVDCPSG